MDPNLAIVLDTYDVYDVYSTYPLMYFKVSGIKKRKSSVLDIRYQQT